MQTAMPARCSRSPAGRLRRVLEAGEQLPDVTVFDLERQPVRLRSLVDDGPILLLFYLFDWSPT